VANVCAAFERMAAGTCSCSSSTKARTHDALILSAREPNRCERKLDEEK
jgi:hypothetical protein